MNWLSLAFPVVYLAILIGSLSTFSYVYRQRRATKAASLAPWFPPHLQRNIYLSLLHHEPEEGNEKSAKVPDSVLKAALLRRATEDIHRIIAVRNAKQALSTLLQKGCVGDELWQRFLRAEKEIEEELRDVVNEANAFAPGWGQNIFQSANEMANNAMIRKRMDELQAQATAEKEWWEKRKATIQTNFMKELDEEKSASTLSPTARSVASPTGTSATGKSVSDDDAVIVESGGPKESQGGGKKKKKGKH
ncbi:hypothetical protein NA57DRAFT_67330 [Rhizodiscina lignyota]|uniref:Translocation protein n=1 Tax=Rhizodiscina lignyota TaxID=1504668 RepID=A0A9P4M3F7_9PEZI|nr:hypothetical protein NA57DRAFT_67330 [Rhizodiscina lignyota]